MGDKNQVIETLDLGVSKKNNENKINENKEKKSGKLSLIIVIILLAILGLAGIGFYYWDSNRNGELEETMQAAAIDYYENEMRSISTAGAYNVTLSDLNNSKKEYNLDILSGCNVDKTKAVISIDYVSGEITETKVVLDCK